MVRTHGMYHVGLFRAWFPGLTFQQTRRKDQAPGTFEAEGSCAFSNVGEKQR